MENTKWLSLEEIPNLFDPNDISGKETFVQDPENPKLFKSSVHIKYESEFYANPDNVLFAMRLCYYLLSKSRNIEFKKIFNKINVEPTMENIRVFYFPLIAMALGHANTNIARKLFSKFPEDIASRLEGYEAIKGIYDAFVKYEQTEENSFCPKDPPELLDSMRFLKNWK